MKGFQSHYGLKTIYILDVFQWVAVIIHCDVQIDPLVSPLVLDNFFGYWPFPEHGTSRFSKAGFLKWEIVFRNSKLSR